jgi:restriction endonuclease XhoI-like protein
MLDFPSELSKAVKHFWQVRSNQKKRQGTKSGKKDAGERSSVTGGKHADGFINLLQPLLKMPLYQRLRFMSRKRSRERCPVFTGRAKSGILLFSPPIL